METVLAKPDSELNTATHTAQGRGALPIFHLGGLIHVGSYTILSGYNYGPSSEIPDMEDWMQMPEAFHDRFIRIIPAVTIIGEVTVIITQL